jgi:acyl-CoA synthetase (AMP-forming)/AMP-acid ligase II
VPDGEPGELVFTSLTKQAFPVIRYRTRDLTRLLPGSAYPAMRRMEKITGRDDDMIILRGVNLFPTQIEEIALGIETLTPHFILELTRQGHLDALKVRIERHPDVDLATCLAAAEVLKLRIKTSIGTGGRAGRGARSLPAARASTSGSTTCAEAAASGQASALARPGRAAPQMDVERARRRRSERKRRTSRVHRFHLGRLRRPLQRRWAGHGVLAQRGGRGIRRVFALQPRIASRARPR